MRRTAGFLAAGLLPLAALAADARFTVEDFVRIAEVSGPDFSPDGEFLVYAVEAANLDADEPVSDLWRVRWDGRDRRALTSTPDANEWSPVYSPDGRNIAFLSDRGGEDAETQVWLMPAAGGEAEQATKFPGGVSEFAWSPDSARLAVIASDPERPESEQEPPKPAPIVIDRYFFKEDETGWLSERRQHLYVFDLKTREVTQLTSGSHDEYLPSWSPDGKLIAYATKRGADPDRHLNWDIYLIEPRAGAAERQLTTAEGSDVDPSWESRPEWSPDSRRIAYLRSGEDRHIYYKPWQLHVIDVETGAVTIPADIDRCFTRPRFSRDGRSVLALIEQSRVTQLSRIELGSGRIMRLTSGLRSDSDFDVAEDRRIVVLGGDDLHPYRLQAVERGGLRTIADHNEWLADRRLARTEPISFASADRIIEGLLVRPVDEAPGRTRTMRPVIDFETCVKCTLCWLQCPDSCFDVTPDGLYDARMESCCGCGVCEAVCPVDDCVTMVNESEFTDNASQWEMWKADKDGYKTWLAEKIQHRPERSHGFRLRGLYQEQIKAMAAVGMTKSGQEKVGGEDTTEASAGGS